MILFARLNMQYLLENYFADKPDIWVFGTMAGYRGFIGRLERRAIGCDEYTSLPAANEVGMDVLIMSTCREASKPFLVLQERVIFQRERLNMQLIVGGSAEGFRYLAEGFEHCLKWVGDPSEHVHIDEISKIVAPPCVNLNIRAPVSKWTKESIGPDYWPLCTDPRRVNRLPTDISGPFDSFRALPHPDYRDLFGRIPLKRKKTAVV
jgi:hypothetical protein